VQSYVVATTLQENTEKMSILLCCCNKITKKNQIFTAVRENVFSQIFFTVCDVGLEKETLNSFTLIALFFE
jgi:hypothetical protein